MSGHSPEKLVATYLKIKARKAEQDAEYKEKDDVLVQQMDMIKIALLDHCKENNVESVRTTAGTFFRQIKTKYWTNDWAAMGAWIVENALPDLLEKRLQQTNMKQYLEDNPGAQVPGLQVESEYTVTVRKA